MEHKSVIISEPEFTSHQLSGADDLLILSSDGLYRSYSNDHIVSRVQYWRNKGYTLAQVSEKIIDECLLPEKNKRPPNDNLTLLIIDLAAYHKP